MKKIKFTKMISDFKYMALKRWTGYNNHFPYNCGYIWPNGCLTFDCIGLIKTYINDPKIAHKIGPANTWITPGQVIPDGATAPIIMSYCTKRSGNFKKVQPCSFLMYEDYDHGGLYVGKFTDDGGIVNVVECCDDPVGSGVTTSYCDSNGYRWDHKGGICLGRWIQHGLLTKYVDYTEEKKKKTNEEIAKEVIAGKWGNYPERKNRLEKAGYNYRKIQALVEKMI